jgi:ribosomal protein S13
MKLQLSEIKRMQQLAGLLTEDQSAEQIADKVENSLESKLDNLSPEQIQQLKSELAQLGVTAETPVETIAQDIESEMNEAEGDDKQKLANTLDGIGTGLLGSLLVPLIPVAIGSTGIGVAAGFGITLAAAGLLKGLAQALKNK